MKVLGVSNTAEILGGGEYSFALSLSLIRQSGWSVAVLLPGDGSFRSHLVNLGFETLTAPQATLWEGANWRYLFHPHPDWIKVVDRYAPDVIHCNAVRAALYAQALTRRSKIPLVLHARKTERLPWIDSWIPQVCDAILCISEEVKHRFPRSRSQQKLQILYNAVDFAAFAEPAPGLEKLRKEWMGESAAFLVGVVGRLSEIKGQHLVVSAAPKVLSEFPRTRFVFVGAEDSTSPGFERKLKQEIASRQMTDHFVFAGFVPDPVSIYQALDLIVFPTASEGFGRVIIEAGAAKKPLITSDIPVIREVLDTGLKDLMIPTGQVAPLEERLLELMRRPDLRESCARRLEAHVRARFDVETHRRRLLEIYEAVLRGSMRPPDSNRE